MFYIDAIEEPDALYEICRFYRDREHEETDRAAAKIYAACANYATLSAKLIEARQQYRTEDAAMIKRWRALVFKSIPNAYRLEKSKEIE